MYFIVPKSTMTIYIHLCINDIIAMTYHRAVD